MSLTKLTAAEAAELIPNNANVGFSGFTAGGSPKVVPSAIAARAEKLNADGQEYKINIFTGASTNEWADGALARANAQGIRTPYQNTPDLRKRINSHDCHYFDLHLSELAQKVRYKTYGDIDYAIIEVADYNDNGEVVLGLGVGNVPTFAMMAKHVILEHNHKLPKGLYGFHDIYIPMDPPQRREIPVYTPSDRIGSPVVKIDPAKIVGVVDSDSYDGIHGFTAPDDVTLQIGANVCGFLLGEYRAGRIPRSFLPLQSGVGNVANAVLYGLAENHEIPPVEMYTEVTQDAVIELMKMGRCHFASSCSLTISDAMEQEVLSNLEFFRDKMVLRPAEISNNPEVIRRLGIIAMNTALEADIFGNINSTHVVGTKMMNGIGGSGDFARNARVCIFATESVAKGGLISCIVPMVSHVDQTEHDVQVIITEQGIADLRWKTPRERAELIIENCAHPDYRPMLREYYEHALDVAAGKQTPHDLAQALSWHQRFLATGTMKP